MKNLPLTLSLDEFISNFIDGHKVFDFIKKYIDPNFYIYNYYYYDVNSFSVGITGTGYIYKCNTTEKVWTRSCGLEQDETPDCPAYTVPPSVSLYNMNSGTILTESNTSFYPQIKVYDNENDNLECKYFIDGSSTAAGTITVSGTYPEKVVTFNTPINAAGFSEGIHTIKVTTSDNFAKDIGQSTISFKVDKSAPVSSVMATNSVSSIRLDVSATDSCSGLAAKAYRYTIGSNVTDWLNVNNYTVNGLTPNTTYSYKVEVRDAAGHISTITGSTYTKVDTPVITATALSENLLKVIINDSNPSSTYYRIKIGNGYANASGSYVSSESWYTLPYNPTAGGKQIIIYGLAPNTLYNISVSAKNSITGDITSGTSVSALTSPGKPMNLICSSNSYNNITLNWASVAGAASYQYCREILLSDGVTYVQEVIKNTTSLTINDSNLQPNQNYRYRVRAINSAGLYGQWSDYISVKTYPIPPDKVINVRAVADGNNLNITWDQVSGAIGYKLTIICDGTQEIKYSTVNQYSLNTANKYNSQCDITVQAFNVCNGDISDISKWANGGIVSDKISSYTSANTPILNTDITNITPNSLTVTWQPNGNPASVKYSLGVFKNNVLVFQSNYSFQYECNVQYLEPDTLYKFKVKAINSGGIETAWSNEVSASTLIDYPAIPSGLTASSTTNSITLKWDAADRAQIYQVKRGEEIIAELNASELTFTDTNVVPETSYTYSISAVNAAGISWSQSITQKTKQTKPSAPVVSITGTNISVTLDWLPVEGVSGYDVLADGMIYNVGLDTTYTHYGLEPGSLHNYRVRARKDTNIGEWSQVISFETIPDLPGTPGNIAIHTTDNQIKVSWSSAIYAEYYDIEIDGIVYSNIYALEYLHTVQDENLEESEHTVRVRAVNSAGFGAWSEFCLAVLGENGGEPILDPLPAVPNVACSVSGSAIQIVWNETEGASVYKLEADNIIIYTGPNTSYIHKGLAENSLHQYRVAAGNLSGFSDWSDPAYAITEAELSTTPRNITYYRENDSMTTVTWMGANSALGYRIEINRELDGNIINDTRTSIYTEPGEQYCIRIAAIIPSGDTELLDWSDEITFRTPIKLPAAPVIDNISATSDTIALSWAGVMDAVGYDIEFNGRITDIRNTINYVINNLTPATTYTIRIRAYNEAGKGDWSNSTTIMTNDSIPGVPVNITGNPIDSVNNLTGSAILLTWVGCDNATSYEVEDDTEQIYQTDANEIIIEGLSPGKPYTFRIRALTETAEGPWSSWVSVIPTIAPPKNVSVSVADGTVSISWDKVGGAELYEIELGGITVATTNETNYAFNYDWFYLRRSIRIRACFGMQKSEWSQAITFGQALPITVDLVKNEEISILLPVSKAVLGKYKLTLAYNPEELLLLDAFEATPEAEIQSAFIEEYKASIFIEQIDNMRFITFLVQTDEDASYTGIISSIRFKSMITGPVTLTYEVIEK